MNTIPQEQKTETTFVNENKLKELGVNRLPKSLKTYGLNFKQIRFADEYFKSLNATDAYRRVYAVEGKTAEQGGSRLSNHPKVKLYLQEKLKKRQAKDVVTVNKIEEEFALIAFSNLYDIFKENEEGKLLIKAGEELTREQKACMQSLKVTKHLDGSQTVVFKLYNKIDALNALAKMKGAFREDGKDSTGGKTFDQAVKERKLRKQAHNQLRERGEVDRP